MASEGRAVNIANLVRRVTAPMSPGLALCWTSGLSVDGDGAPNCYGPPGSETLDDLACAGHPGNWWGLACDASGQPYVQTIDDFYPGYYISVTALCDGRFPESSPRRYVNAERVPYISIPPELREMGVGMGDLAYVVHGELGSPAIVADEGPRGKIGEGSIALATALGIPASARTGGVDAGVDYIVWPGTALRPRWPRPVEDAAALYQAWTRTRLIARGG